MCVCVCVCACVCVSVHVCVCVCVCTFTYHAYVRRSVYTHMLFTVSMVQECRVGS